MRPSSLSITYAPSQKACSPRGCARSMRHHESHLPDRCTIEADHTAGTRLHSPRWHTAHSASLHSEPSLTIPCRSDKNLALCLLSLAGSSHPAVQQQQQQQQQQEMSAAAALAGAAVLAHVALSPRVAQVPFASPALAATEGHLRDGPVLQQLRVLLGKAPSSSTSVGRLCGWGLPSGLMPFEESGLCALSRVTRLLWCAPLSERGAVQRVELAIGRA